MIILRQIMIPSFYLLAFCWFTGGLTIAQQPNVEIGIRKDLDNNELKHQHRFKRELINESQNEKGIYMYIFHCIKQQFKYVKTLYNLITI